MSAEEPTAAEKRLRERQARAAAAGKAGSVGISGEDALEAVSDLEGKVETWHLAAEERLSEERVRRDADQAKLEEQLGALAAAVTRLAGSSEVGSDLRPRPREEGSPPSPEPEPESGSARTGTGQSRSTDPLEAAEDELLILQAKSEEVESRRARLAGENPRNLWADPDGGSGGGGSGRLDYQGIAIRYLRKPYRRQAEVYTRQIEGDIAELQLPEKKVIIGENLVPCYERLHEESQHEVDYLWFALGRFRDVLSSVSTVGFALCSGLLIGLPVQLRPYCTGARSCMVSKNTEKGSISVDLKLSKTGHARFSYFWSIVVKLQAARADIFKGT